MESFNQTGMQDILDALQQQNLVYNSDFRYYSNQVPNGNVITYNAPDGWVYTDPGTNGSISFDEATSSCKIVKSQDSSTMRFSQALHEFPRWKQVLPGNTVTARVSLSISTANEVSVLLTDGIDTNRVTRKGTGSFEIEVQLYVNPTATVLTLAVECSAAYVTILISEACANVGQLALPNLPCVVQGVIGERRQYIATETAPAGELSLCTASAELGPDYTRLSTVLNGRFGTGANKRSLLPDVRGYFTRVWDNGAGTDPDAASRTALGGTVKGDHVGTLEDDQFRQHTHPLGFSTDKPFTGGTGPSSMIVNTTSSSDTKATGGKETRPKNISELYTIKWA